MTLSTRSAAVSVGLSNDALFDGPAFSPGRMAALKSDAAPGPLAMAGEPVGPLALPSLTGFGPSVTFDEAAVNAMPQVLDTDVVLTDAEGDFDGGTVAVTGLTSGEVVTVNNEGTDPGQIGLDSGVITYGGVPIGFLGGIPGVDLVVTLNAAATSEAVDALVQNLAYLNSSDTPAASRDLTLTITDAGGESASQTITVNITAQDDASVAQDDYFETLETEVVTGNLFADNGSGTDFDPDSTLTITAIDGQAFTFGQPVTLASGALLTVAENGDFSFDPNGMFEDLAAQASGAIFGSFGQDNFTYTLSGGAIGAVTVGINGVDNNDVVRGKFGATNNLNGGVGDDLVYGGSVNDILAGGIGDDRLDGGEGIDTAYYNAATGPVEARLDDGVAVTDGDGGSDTLVSIENLIGSEFGDYLVGDAGTNDLDGRDGNDVLIGRGGDDVLTGGLGGDVLLGQEGNDTLIGGTGAPNTLQGGLGDDLYVVEANDTVTEFSGEGTDTIQTDRGTYVLRANFENLTSIGSGPFRGTGNAIDNVIIGNLAADTLTGLDGADTLSGRGGVDILDGGNGLDTADYSGASAGVSVRLSVQATLDDGDGARDTLVSIENVICSDSDDVLFGSADANVISGGLGRDIILGLGGDDTLIGGAGAANQMQGGLGDDTYVVDAHDTLVELANEGTDTVQTSRNFYTLAANIENLTFTGAGAFTGLGNAHDNVITGGADADVLTGGRGDDTLNGGDGLNYVVLSGVRADYAITDLGGGSYQIVDSIDGRDGTDLTTGIERVRFASGPTVALADLAAAAPPEPVDKAAAGPQILPGLADDFVLGKDGGAPEVLPAADDPFGVLDTLAPGPDLLTQWMTRSVDTDGALGFTAPDLVGVRDDGGWAHQ